MTLVQASICNKGESIIVIGDRLVTIKGGQIGYETEGKNSKIFCFGNNIIGFAGLISDIIMIKNELEDKSQNVEEFVEYASKTIKDKIDYFTNNFIKRFTLHERTDFISDKQGHGEQSPMR